MRADIISYWSTEKGEWSLGQKKYINRTWSEERKKELGIVIDDDRYPEKPIMYFIGGPTGYESYYLETFLQDLSREEGRLFICAGTINSWPRCYVMIEELLPIIREYFETEGIKFKEMADGRI